MFRVSALPVLLWWNYCTWNNFLACNTNMLGTPNLYWKITAWVKIFTTHQHIAIISWLGLWLAIIMYLAYWSNISKRPKVCTTIKKCVVSFYKTQNSWMSYYGGWGKYCARIQLQRSKQNFLCFKDHTKVTPFNLFLIIYMNN